MNPTRTLFKPYKMQAKENFTPRANRRKMGEKTSILPLRYSRISSLFSTTYTSKNWWARRGLNPGKSVDKWRILCIYFGSFRSDFSQNVIQ